MKKLLILTLVMGLASSANAALTLVSSAGLTLDPTGVFAPSTTLIGIYNDTAAPGQGLLTYLAIPQPATAGWTGVDNVYAPPSLGGVNTYYGIVAGGDVGQPTDVDMWESNLAIASVDPYGIGVLADFELQCTGDGPVTITLFGDDIATVLDRIQIEQIPEPFTFGLLGLGGLFLRRRK